MSIWSTVGDLAKKAGSAALDEGKNEGDVAHIRILN